MDTHLVRSVEIPEPRHRPLVAMTALAVLFAFGSYAYVLTTRCPPYALTAVVSFHTEPPGAAVADERHDEILCITPCAITVRPGVDGFRLVAPGHEQVRVLVSTRAGDVRVDATLPPLR